MFIPVTSRKKLLSIADKLMSGMDYWNIKEKQCKRNRKCGK
jgi:hypothetical protein